MIPPLMSSTLSAQDILGNNGQSNKDKSLKEIEGTNSEGGRPELPDE